MFLILLRLDAPLALLSLAVVPLLYACLRYYSTRMVNRAQQVKELESRLVDRVYEILSGIKVVKSFAREPHELERFADVGRETMSARLRYVAGVGVHVGRGRDHLEWHGRRARGRRAARPAG